MGDPADAWLLVLVAAVITIAWRALATVVAERVDVDMAIFEWFGCVSYAMVAGLMLRALMQPTNALAELGMADRLVPVAVGIAVFFIWGRRVVPAWLLAIALFAGIVYLGGLPLP